MMCIRSSNLFTTICLLHHLWLVRTALLLNKSEGTRIMQENMHWLTKGGGGVWIPPFLADIICEQPLTGRVRKGWIHWTNVESERSFDWKIQPPSESKVELFNYCQVDQSETSNMAQYHKVIDAAS